MKEIWRDIPEYEKLYQVSNLGRIRSLPRNTTKGQILKQACGGRRREYLYVQLCKNGSVKNYFIHRLMLLAFVHPAPSKRYVTRHLDGNSKNNKLNNLRWGTQKENIQDRDKHKTTARGSKNGSSKLTENDVRQIKLLLNKNMSLTQIGKMYGVTHTLISYIRDGKLWKHIK